MLVDATSWPLSAGAVRPAMLINSHKRRSLAAALLTDVSACGVQAYRDLAKRHPSFRERSETTDLIVEISLQPWRSFQPDGVILFRSVLHRNKS